MAIYKKDLIVTPDGTRHGKQLTGDEIRMPYRIASSITQNGTTYAFSHRIMARLCISKVGRHQPPCGLLRNSHPSGVAATVRAPFSVQSCRQAQSCIPISSDAITLLAIGVIA